jgi:hypothetical protein
MREKLEELAWLHARRFDDDMAQATIGDAFPAILEYVREITAERDQLRAENERLRKSLDIRTTERDCLQETVDRWLDRAEAAEADAAKCRAELEAHAADLRGALDWINRRGGCGLDVHDRINAALARTQAQSLDILTAKVLRGAAEGLRNMAEHIENSRTAPCTWEACEHRLLEIADQLDRQAEANRQEAANG